jgi:hypothetical protein
MDDGAEVFGIGTGPLADSIDRKQIEAIYSMWVRAKKPFGA